MILLRNIGCWLKQRNSVGYTRIERYVLNTAVTAAAALLFTSMLIAPAYQMYTDYQAKKACEAVHGVPCKQRTLYVPK